MAKKKGFKITTKKVPPEKFLVVTNAWGLSPTGDVSILDINNVGAWFEVMLRDIYPGARIKSIYYQKTHKNLIIELPRQVTDITHYLGRHNYRDFLTHSPHSEKFAEIYEYKYSRHGDPGEKNWTTEYPTYREIPDGIPLKSPYPTPGLAGLPPIDIADYAYPIPPDVYNVRALKLNADFLAKTAAANAQASSSSSAIQKFTIHHEQPDELRVESMVGAVPPLLNSSQLQKGKGLDMNDTASNFTPHIQSGQLPEDIQPPTERMPRANNAELQDIDAQDYISLSVKNEEVEGFLQSLIPQPPVNEERISSPLRGGPDLFDMEDDYEPSAELLAMLGDLPPEIIPNVPQHQDQKQDTPPLFIKPEPVEDGIPEYEPSGELLESLSSLPLELFQSAIVPFSPERLGKDEVKDIRIKSEYRETTLDDVLFRSAPEVKVKPEPVDHKLMASSSMVEVKPEPSDYSYLGSSSQVKVEIKAESLEYKPPRTGKDLPARNRERRSTSRERYDSHHQRHHRPDRNGVDPNVKTDHMSTTPQIGELSPPSHFRVKDEPRDNPQGGNYRPTDRPPHSKYDCCSETFAEDHEIRMKRESSPTSLGSRHLKRVKREYDDGDTWR